MAHELSRLVAAYGAHPWLIDGARAAQIVEAIEYRAEHGIAAAAARRDASAPDGQRVRAEEIAAPVGEAKTIGVINLVGTIMPRVSGIDAMSGDFVSLTRFQNEFTAMAARTDLKAIIMNIDSPGGQVDLVPETAAMVRAARRADRPIIAIANTLAASAAYFIASAADELVVTPSGLVGSIGVFTVHQDISEKLQAQGVRMTVVKAGPRKFENHPFAPLDALAEQDLQRRIQAVYGDFVSAVARHRNVSEDVVRADPEAGQPHFGGGRAYEARLAVDLGMADRVETFSDLVARLRAPRQRTATARRRALAVS